MVTQSFLLTEPTALSLSTSATQESYPGAADAQRTATPSGGTTPYNIIWPQGGSGTSVTDLSGGTYTVTVIDINGCSVQSTVTVTVANTALSIQSNTTDLLCNGDGNGTASVSISGGVPPYVYAWSTGDNTAQVTGLAGGTYSLSVTDQVGQELVTSYSIIEPQALIDNATVIHESIIGNNDGFISLAVSGGSAPYTYIWTTGDNTSSIGPLGPGPYGVTVTDQNGCSAQFQYNINAGITVLVSLTGSTSVTCDGFSDGSASVSASDGQPPYAYT